MSYKENLDIELNIAHDEDVQMAIPYFDITPKQVSTGKGFEIPSSDIGNGLKAIDLFCGIGGFKIGLDKLGVKTVFSSDIDKFAQETYHLNFGEKPHGDITKIEAKNIPSFDILTAGFPCQPFSYAGLNQGFEDKTRGTLFFDICRIIEFHRPEMFLLENVKGLKSHNGGETLNTILETLKGLGYTTQWTIINSLDFDIPQARERWYCVGFKNRDIEFEFPEKTAIKLPKLDKIIDNSSNFDKKLRLTDFELDRIKFHFSKARNGERIEHDASKYAPNTKKGKHGIFSFQKPDKSLRFHVGDFAKTQIQEAFYTCKDTFAPTIIAGRVPKMWDLERKLSVLEAKRLQGFPDDFRFSVSDNQAYKQLGNAVCVPVVHAILNQMVKAFKNI
jgi:DNA (cytosine-5)-methyltransferase 1